MPTSYTRRVLALLVGTSDTAVEVSSYGCKGFRGRKREPGKAHSYYLGPKGEIVTHSGHGHYNWSDRDTGQLHDARAIYNGRRIHHSPGICPDHGTPTALHSVVSLTIIKGGSGVVKITHATCWGPRRGQHHAIYFGPEGQIVQQLPLVPGKRPCYEFADTSGALIQVQHKHTPKTRRKISLGDKKFWKKSGKRMRRILGARSVRKKISDSNRKRCAKRKADQFAVETELAELRAKVASGNGTTKPRSSSGAKPKYSESELRRAIAANKAGKSWPEAAKEIRPSSWAGFGARAAGEELRKAVSYYLKRARVAKA
jgi:hypothetical protein